MTATADDALRQAAIRSLERKQAFRRHAVVYVLVNLLLVGIWFYQGVSTGDWAPWFLFPLLGWGIGLGAQAWATYRDNGLTEAKIDAEMTRISRNGLPG